MGFDSPASNVDGGIPKIVHRVPGEAISRDRDRKPSVRRFLVLHNIMGNLTVESSVREVRPGDKRLMRHVTRGRISQPPLVAVNELRAVRVAVMREEDPFLPAGTVAADLEGVDAQLGLVGGARSYVVGEIDGLFAGAVAEHGRRRGGFGGDQGGQSREYEAEVSESQHRDGGKTLRGKEGGGSDLYSALSFPDLLWRVGKDSEKSRTGRGS